MSFVTLIGYRGSGKSSVAPLLAGRLGWDWADSDIEVRQRSGSSIAEIFREAGEPAFRELERAAICDLLRRNRLVLAVGGGAILNAATAKDISDRGPVVWLRGDIQTLARRLAEDENTPDSRPGLTGQASARDEIAEVLRQRTPLYAALATVTVDTDKLSPDEVADRILEQLPASVKDGGVR